MSLQRKRWLSTISGGVLLTLFGLIALTVSGINGMAQTAKKATAKAAAPAEEEVFPHMDQALAYLQAALKQLDQAEPWFGGHREKAIEHVKVSIADIQAGIGEYMSKHPAAVRNEVNPDTIEVKMGFHFSEAQRLTQEAQTHLTQASKIFYGKRADAIANTKAAIEEMQAGDAYYKAHPQK